MNISSPRISAADVFAPPAREAPVIKPDIDIPLARIRAMLDGCGTSNRNDLLVIAIEALIEVGVDTGPRIVGAARSLGFKPSHAGAVLRSAEGSDPGRHRWRRGTDGGYRLHAA